MVALSVLFGQEGQNIISTKSYVVMLGIIKCTCVLEITPKDRLQSRTGSHEFLHTSLFTIGIVVDLTGGGGGRSLLLLFRNRGGGGIGGATSRPGNIALVDSRKCDLFLKNKYLQFYCQLNNNFWNTLPPETS